MKTKTKTETETDTRHNNPSVQASRSVKIADDIHYQCRVLAAERRMGIQEFIEEMLVFRLKQLTK